MRADLHMHSVCSDGALPPAELARRVKEAGVELFSLTDHDNMSGCAEATAAAKQLGLHFIRGIEVSAYLGAAKVHVLGYGCRENGAYFNFLEERRAGARTRAADCTEKANALLGLDVTMDEVEGYHVRREAPLHTMHVVKAFAARLHADMGALYRELFAPGCPAFSDLCRPTPREAVHLIRDMGGVSVLAHPAQILLLPAEVSVRFRFLSAEEREAEKRACAGKRLALMEELAAEGLWGIECLHSTHTAGETEEFSAFAAAHALCVTGGSDFHADGTARTIGTPVFDAAEAECALLALEGSV